MRPAIIFQDRAEAGRLLAARLLNMPGLPGPPPAVVLGIPGGGVPVAAPVAQALGAELGPFFVRKLGVPGQPELAMGAVASGGLRVLNDDVIRALGIPRDAIDAVTEREMQKLAAQEIECRGGAGTVGLPDIAGRTVIVVDDGAATGATLRAGLMALAKLHPARLIVALPTASIAAREALRPYADQVVVLDLPDPFYSVGESYREFGHVTSREVAALLAAAR